MNTRCLLPDLAETLRCDLPIGTDLKALIYDMLEKRPWLGKPAHWEEYIRERKIGDMGRAGTMFSFSDRDGKLTPAFMYFPPHFADYNYERSKGGGGNPLFALNHDGYRKYSDVTGDESIILAFAHEWAHALLPPDIYPDVLTMQGPGHGILHDNMTLMLAKKLIPGLENRIVGKKVYPVDAVRFMAHEKSKTKHGKR